MKLIEFSFIIATINRVILCKRALDSIYTQSILTPFEVIVVDQSIDDKTKLLCQNYNNLIFIQNPEKGLSLSRNLGIKKASGRILIFVDDDGFLDPSYLKNLSRLLRKYPNCKGFAGIIYNIEDKKTFSRYHTKNNTSLTLLNYDKFLSSNIVLKKEIFNEIGMFDIDFGVGRKWGGSEDTDILIRGLLHKADLLYSSEIIVYHPKCNFSSFSFQQIFNKMYSYGLGRGALYKKYARILPHWAIIQLLLSFLKASLGLAISLIFFNRKGAIKNLGAIAGRARGFLTYSGADKSTFFSQKDNFL